MIAMVARQYPSDRKRVSVPVSLNAGARHDDRTDSGRRDSRPDPDRRPASSSTTITLEDILKTMANLQEIAIPALLAVTTGNASLALELTTFGLRDPQRTQPHPMRIPS